MPQLVVERALLTLPNPARSTDYRADRHRTRAPINNRLRNDPVWSPGSDASDADASARGPESILASGARAGRRGAAGVVVRDRGRGAPLDHECANPAVGADLQGMAVVMRQRLTPQSLAYSIDYRADIAYRADRRHSTVPNNTPNTKSFRNFRFQNYDFSILIRLMINPTLRQKHHLRNSTFRSIYLPHPSKD